MDKIPFTPDLGALASQLHIRLRSPLLNDLIALVNELQAVARPKAFYRIVLIDFNGGEDVILDGIRFHSRLLCTNLAKAHRAFPYLATCGTELQEWRDRETDVLYQFWADAVMKSAVATALEALRADLQLRFQPGMLSRMNPGSLEDWPISQQAPFFELLGESARATGVILTPSMLMIPAKSVTGLFFEGEHEFVNCAFCPRNQCPARRLPHDPDLKRQYLS